MRAPHLGPGGVGADERTEPMVLTSGFPLPTYMAAVARPRETDLIRPRRCRFNRQSWGVVLTRTLTRALTQPRCCEYVHEYCDGWCLSECE